MLSTFLDAATARSYFANCLPLFQQRGNAHLDLTVRDVLVRDDWLVVYRLHLSPVAGGVTSHWTQRSLIFLTPPIRGLFGSTSPWRKTHL